MRSKMSKAKFKSKDAKLQNNEHHPKSSFADAPVKNENDEKVDEHPVTGVAVYEAK